MQQTNAAEHNAHRTVDFLASRNAHIRMASATNLAYYEQSGNGSQPYRMDAPEEYYAQSTQQQHQQQAAQFKQSKSRSGSQRDLSQFEQHEAAFRTLNVSAGDLLSRTHEELVLLLIQLRRQNSITARSIEQCCTDIHEVQNRIRTCDGSARAENLTRLEQLKRQLLELEKQYEKSKPLVNLVDNMVKLGSLYRNGTASVAHTPGAADAMRQGPAETVTLDRLEFNQRVQERRQLHDEQKHWDRISPNQSIMQNKVQQLYQLDQLLHEESGTMQSLQRDKEDLERALGGLRRRLHEGHGPPQALDAARKQQHTLERELSRVHQLLADNSKKLEQTVAGNARLEQELLVLRQKLQATRGAAASSGARSIGGGGSHADLHSMLRNDDVELTAGATATTAATTATAYTSGTTAVLESELRRVQHLVGDMQRQRHELSQAVRQLTENTHSLGARPHGSSSSTLDMKPLAATAASNGDYQPEVLSPAAEAAMKKRPNSSGWTETDLDSMYSSHDHSGSGLDVSMDNLSLSGLHHMHHHQQQQQQPLFIDTVSSTAIGETSAAISRSTSRSYMDHHNNAADIMAEAKMQLTDSAFAQLSGMMDKPEPKTVRIVKRESERRHRERGTSGGASGASSALNLEHLDEAAEEQHQQLQQQQRLMMDDYSRSKSLPRSYLDTDALYTQPEVKAKRMSASSTAIQQQHNYSDYMMGMDAVTTASAAHQMPAYPVSLGPVESYARTTTSTSQSNGSADLGGYLSQSTAAASSKNPFHMYVADEQQQAKHHSANSAGGLRQKTESLQSLSKAMDSLSPVFQSEAARQIIIEMGNGSSSGGATAAAVDELLHGEQGSMMASGGGGGQQLVGKTKRSNGRQDKRRYMTAPSNTMDVKSMQSMQTENDMNSNNTNWRARDDLDMEVALRPRINAPDVVRSALGQRDKISENSIDRLFAAPSKIVIPERYIPEQAPELSPEEKRRRQEKVEAIKKMLSEAPINQSNDSPSLPASQISAEKKQREHLLQLNQILAQQVMQMSKIVAERAMSGKADDENSDSDRDNESLGSPLPIYQQRDNFFS